MPKKKKNITKKVPAPIEVETSDDQVEIPKRSLRPRCKVEARVLVSKLSAKYLPSPKTKKKKIKESRSENEYDADSELDQNPESDPETDLEEKRMTSKERKTRHDLVTDMGENLDEEKSMNLVAAMGKHRPFVLLDKENVTPPGSHSTPSAVQRAVRNLDDSLFGFNDLESPLPFSPVRRTPAHDPVSPVSSTKSSVMSISPTKRKMVTYSSISDMAIENPKKRSRRKAKKEVSQEPDLLEEIREQFKEVEMHELIIE